MLSFLYLQSLANIEYVGENLLLGLGVNTSSIQFKDVKEFWLLDSKLENKIGGLKFIVNPTNQKIESILVAGEPVVSSTSGFQKYTAKLPFLILLNDDTSALVSKLGKAEKMEGKNAFKFHVNAIVVEVSYTDLVRNKISYIRFYKEAVAVISLLKPSVVTLSKVNVSKKDIETNLVMPTTTNAAIISATIPVFKKAILDVFNSYRASNLVNIKGAALANKNFWNYKYTYASDLKIPGEKANMLYSYPFINSQLDFVSVIKESDVYDASFTQAYKEFEIKLMANFPETEGWTAVCSPNNESKTLSDLEIKNGSYGSIILDYCKSPQGKHVLFLRFLLFSN